jgi:hypothetical protein
MTLTKLLVLLEYFSDHYNLLKPIVTFSILTACDGPLLEWNQMINFNNFLNTSPFQFLKTVSTFYDSHKAFGAFRIFF